MSKMLKLLFPGLVVIEGLCTALAVDESLKKVDTIPNWVLTIARSTMTVLITVATWLAATKVYFDSIAEEKTVEVENTEDDDEELEFEDDLD